MRGLSRFPAMPRGCDAPRRSGRFHFPINVSTSAFATSANSRRRRVPQQFVRAPRPAVGAMATDATAALAAPKLTTLLVVVSDGNVLLGEKKRGFGAGLWNGFGGKVDLGIDASVEHAALRELREECGIDALDATRRWVLTFHYADAPNPMETHVFHASAFEGTVAESDEMRPAWFPEDAIPLEKMWPDDEHWYPAFLRGEKFVGTFWFDREKKITRHELEVVETLPARADGL